ncbi:MAG: cell division protein ZapA [Pseudomonadota bacterium]
MPDVKVSVNKQTYSLTCGDGEEERVQKLAGYLDGHVQKLVSDLGHLGDGRLLLLAALNICDELFTAREQLIRVGKEPDTTGLLNSSAERIERCAQELAAQKTAPDREQ